MKPGTRVLVCESHGIPVGISGTVVRKHTVTRDAYWVELDVRHRSCCQCPNDDQVSVLREECLVLP